MTQDELPEVEPPLPDNLLDRLEELHRRKEQRGLTNLERMVVMNDLKQFNEAMKPLAQTMAEAMGEIFSNINEAMKPLVEAMSEARVLGECEDCGAEIRLGEWHSEDDPENDDPTMWCRDCTEQEVPDDG